MSGVRDAQGAESPREVVHPRPVLVGGRAGSPADGRQLPARGGRPASLGHPVTFFRPRPRAIRLSGYPTWKSGPARTVALRAILCYAFFGATARNSYAGVVGKHHIVREAVLGSRQVIRRRTPPPYVDFTRSTCATTSLPFHSNRFWSKRDADGRARLEISSSRPIPFPGPTNASLDAPHFVTLNCFSNAIGGTQSHPRTHTLTEVHVVTSPRFRICPFGRRRTGLGIVPISSTSCLAPVLSFP